MTAKHPRVCISCDKPLGANRAKEHIIPAWLIQELGSSEEVLTQRIADSATHIAQDARKPHTLDAFKEGRVCGKCNHGWMLHLETEAKSILPAFIYVKRFITELSEPEALVIARWTLKTAIVLSHGIAFNKPLPVEHLHFLRQNQTELPLQVGVFATVVSPARDFGFVQRNRWENGVFQNLPNEPDFSFMQTGAYKMAIELRNIFLMAAYLPRTTSRFFLAAGVHVPILPNAVPYPSQRVNIVASPISDTYQRLLAFSDSLGALHLF